MPPAELAVDQSVPAAVASPLEKSKSFGWPSLTTSIAAVGAVGGAVLYLVGSTFFRTYYAQWGLDSAMFPSPTDQTIVQGYHSVMNELAEATLWVLGEYALWLIGYAFLAWFVALISGWWEMRWKNRFANTVQRHEGPARVVAMLIASIGLVAIIPVAALVVAFYLLAWPLTAADGYGKEVVARQISEFKLGCDNATTTSRCIALTRGDLLVARGFLIGASESVVAVFDPAAGRTVLVEREGLLLVGAPRGASASGSQPTK